MKQTPKGLCVPPLAVIDASGVMIACDRDPPGMRAAEAAAARRRRDGRKVEIGWQHEGH